MEATARHQQEGHCEKIASCVITCSIQGFTSSFSDLPKVNKTICYCEDMDLVDWVPQLLLCSYCDLFATGSVAYLLPSFRQCSLKMLEYNWNPCTLLEHVTGHVAQKSTTVEGCTSTEKDRQAVHGCTAWWFFSGLDMDAHCATATIYALKPLSNQQSGSGAIAEKHRHKKDHCCLAGDPHFRHLLTLVHMYLPFTRASKIKSVGLMFRHKKLVDLWLLVPSP